MASLSTLWWLYNSAADNSCTNEIWAELLQYLEALNARITMLEQPSDHQG